MRSLRLTLAVFLAPLLTYPVTLGRSWLVEKFGMGPPVPPAPALVLAYVLMLFVGIPTLLVLGWRKPFRLRSLEIAGTLIGGLPPGLWTLFRLTDLFAGDPKILYGEL